MDLTQILPFVMKLQEQNKSQMRPSTLPNIVATILGNKREREKIKQGAAEMAMKERVAEGQLAAEQQRITASQEASKLDAFSRMVASGEIDPEQASQFLQGGSAGNVGLNIGGLKFNGPIPFSSGGGQPYLPPSGGKLADRLLTAQSKEDLYKMIEGQNLSKYERGLVVQKENALASHSEDVPFDPEKFERAKQGDLSDMTMKEAEKYQIAVAREKDNSGEAADEATQKAEASEERRVKNSLDMSTVKEIQKGEVTNRSAAQQLADATSLSPEMFNKQFNTPDGREAFGSLQRKWFEEVQQNWGTEESQKSKPLARLRDVAEQAKRFKVLNWSPEIKEKFYREIWEPLRTETVQSDVWSMGYKDSLFETKKGMKEFAQQGKELASIESLLGHAPTIPFSPEEVHTVYPQTGMEFGNGPRDVNVFNGYKFRAPTRQVTPEEAKKFWEEIEKTADKIPR